MIEPDVIDRAIAGFTAGAVGAKLEGKDIVKGGVITAAGKISFGYLCKFVD